MISFSFLLALVFSSANSANSTGPSVTEIPPSTVNKTLMLQLVNNTRKKGCQCGNTWYPPAPPVTWNDQLEKAAFNHSKDMSQRNYFSHTSPNGDKAGNRIRRAGYNWMTYGENIALGYNSEKEVVAGWIKSAGHCKNIMSRNYKEMGVAKVNSYWTQAFGSK